MVSPPANAENSPQNMSTFLARSEQGGEVQGGSPHRDGMIPGCSKYATHNRDDFSIQVHYDDDSLRNHYDIRSVCSNPDKVAYVCLNPYP